MQINPTHPKKRLALSAYFKNLSRAGDFQSLNKALVSLLKIRNELPCVTSKELAERMNVSHDHAKFLLKKLRENGFIKVIRERIKPTEPFEYDLTDKGREEAAIQAKFF